MLFEEWWGRVCLSVYPHMGPSFEGVVYLRVDGIIQYIVIHVIKPMLQPFCLCFHNAGTSILSLKVCIKYHVCLMRSTYL